MIIIINRQFLTGRNMAPKHYKCANLSACLSVSVTAHKQTSLESGFERLQWLKVSCCLEEAGSMSVVQTLWRNVVQSLLQSRWRKGHHMWTIAVRFCHWQLKQAGRSLIDTVVQDHIEPCRPAYYLPFGVVSVNLCDINFDLWFSLSVSRYILSLTDLLLFVCGRSVIIVCLW